MNTSLISPWLPPVFSISSHSAHSRAGGRVLQSPPGPPPDSPLADPNRPIPDAARLPVVLIHGLFTGRWLWWPLIRALRKDQRTALAFGYRSRWHDIPTNAERFAQWLNSQGSGPFDLITHSLGAVVLRWAASHHSLPRLRRVVMIAPPNRGASITDKLEHRLGPFFPMIYGQTGLQLRRGARGLAEMAGGLNAEIGVIAGGTGSPRGYNPWISGDNDQTVAVEETVVTGMKDFLLLPHRHSALVFAPDTFDAALRFLKTGRFRVPSLDLEYEFAQEPVKRAH